MYFERESARGGERQREREREAERERERGERIPGKLHVVIAEPGMGLHPTNQKIKP